MNSYFSIIGTGLLLVAVLMLCGGVAVVVALLINKQTRWLGALLGLGGVGILFVALLGVIYNQASMSYQRNAAQEQVEISVTRARAAESAAKAQETVPPLIPLDGELDESMKDLPEWVTQPPKRIGKVYRQVLLTGPYETMEECHTALDDALMKSALAYSNQLHLGLSQSDLAAVGVDVEYMKQNVCDAGLDDSYRSKTLDQTMHRLFTQVEFDDSFRQLLHKAYKAREGKQAVAGISAVGGAFLVLVGLAFGALKLDDATAGRYRKRLFLGVPAAIIVATLLAVI